MGTCIEPTPKCVEGKWNTYTSGECFTHTYTNRNTDTYTNPFKYGS
jgi:hypothetical protein